MKYSELFSKLAFGEFDKLVSFRGRDPFLNHYSVFSADGSVKVIYQTNIIGIEFPEDEGSIIFSRLLVGGVKVITSKQFGGWDDDPSTDTIGVFTNTEEDGLPDIPPGDVQHLQKLFNI